MLKQSAVACLPSLMPLFRTPLDLAKALKETDLQSLLDKKANEIRQQKEAVESGYWPLYRFDPRRKLADPEAQCLTVDSPKARLNLQQFLDTENRFTVLQR